MTDKGFFGGLIRLHILPHAAEEPIFGLGIIKELRYHGYKLSTGTLYPMLHGLAWKRRATSLHVMSVPVVVIDGWMRSQSRAALH